MNSSQLVTYGTCVRVELTSGWGSNAPKRPSHARARGTRLSDRRGLGRRGKLGGGACGWVAGACVSRRPVAFGLATRPGSQLASARQHLAEAHATVRAPGPACATTSSQNARPPSYWRSFISRPSSRSRMRHGQPRPRRRWSSRRASRRAWAAVRADRVHHVLGMALDERHRRLHAVHQLPSAPRRGRGAAARRDAALEQLAQRRRRRAGAAASAADTSTCSPSSSSREQPGQMLAQPRRAENWTAWVTSWIATHATSSSRSTSGCAPPGRCSGRASSRRGVAGRRAARCRTGRARAERAPR